MGVAALTEGDLEAYREGRATLAELAAVAGVSKQAVSKALRRRGIKKATAPVTPATASQPSADPSIENPEQLADYVRTKATNAAIGAVYTAEGLMTADRLLGPSALKAAVAALDGSLNVLARLGFLDGAGGGAMALRVEVMTPKEAAEIRRQAEAEARGYGDGDNADDIAGPEMAPAMPLQGAAGLAERDPAPGQGEAGMELDDLRARLTAYGERHGRAGLRALALATGAEVSRGSTACVENIVARAEADPEAWRAISKNLLA